MEHVSQRLARLVVIQRPRRSHDRQGVHRRPLASPTEARWIRRIQAPIHAEQSSVAEAFFDHTAQPLAMCHGYPFGFLWHWHDCPQTFVSFREPSQFERTLTLGLLLVSQGQELAQVLIAPATFHQEHQAQAAACTVVERAWHIALRLPRERGVIQGQLGTDDDLLSEFTRFGVCAHRAVKSVEIAQRERTHPELSSSSYQFLGMRRTTQQRET